MKWSWRIGQIGGIDLRVHATFFILLAWLALVYNHEYGMAGAARGLAFTLALFVSVVLHELGHALAARRVGVPTRDITLLPIGGVARLERMPDKPRQELAIALAGPAVTLTIAVLIGIGLRLFDVPMVITENAIARGGRGALLAQLMWVNVSLLVFNLLPAFPMDGGRVLRATLALRKDYLRATEMAAHVGRAFALLFGVIGFLFNPMLVLIALFVWVGATAEASATQERAMLSGVRVEQLMIHDVRTLAPGDTLRAAVQQVLAGFQHDFPVVRNGIVVGVLTPSALVTGMATHGPESTVAESMSSSFQTADPREPVAGAVSRLHEGRYKTLPVVSGGQLRGVLTVENVMEYVMIEAGRHASAAP